ncbi:MAG: hypothetical protein LBF22_14480 [Deltaproteobacteria bacterium]|jgi:predicted Mrr-cat superfamily restriction endonuclease|nr:hypothetical protein [Deltaproteobacteria bacterium]
MTKHLWVIRPEPNFIDRLADFLEFGMVAIGWPGMGDLRGCVTREDFATRLCGTYEHYSNELKSDLAVAAGILDRFVNKINIGDLVLVPYQENVFIGEVTGDYVFRPELDLDSPAAGYAHWRPVKYLKGSEPYCKIKELPLGVRRGIDCHLSVFLIHSAAKPMWTFLGRTP